MRQESVNDYMTDFTMSEEVLPGKSAMGDASLASWNFSDVGIRSIEDVREVEFKFLLCERDYLSQTITITF